MAKASRNFPLGFDIPQLALHFTISAHANATGRSATSMPRSTFRRGAARQMERYRAMPRGQGRRDDCAAFILLHHALLKAST